MVGSRVAARIAALCLGWIAILSTGASAQMQPDLANVAYGPHALERLDVYFSPGSSPQNPAPVLVEIHAGGWAAGNKSYFPVYGGMIEKIHAKGVTVVSIDYPLAPFDLFPKANNSCRRAIQFIRHNAAAWNIDPARIAVIGASSGAHLAMWVSMAKDAAVPGSPDPVLQKSSRVMACIAYQGPSDLTDQSYSFDGSAGHAVSPVYNFLGVTTNAQWAALPAIVKNELSPRYHIWFGGGPALNRDVSFLGIYSGDPKVKSSAALPKPNSDIHSLLQGLLLKESLKSIGNPEAIVWAGLTDFIPGIGLLAGEMAADWLNLRFLRAKIFSFDGGTPGCVGTQFLVANDKARIGNMNFELRSYNALPNTLGALTVTDARLASPWILPYLGIEILVDLTKLALPPVDFFADSTGRCAAVLPVANDPSLVGRVFYAQAFTPWYTSPGVFPYCNPTVSGLSSTNIISIQIEQ